MKTLHRSKEKGFVLIVSMLVLLVLTILVVNSVRSSVLGEKMAGNYMDRNRAMQAAEQALRQGEAALLGADNGQTCLNGCAITAGAVSASSAAVNTIPSVWADSGSATIAKAYGQMTTGKFQVTQLNDALRAADKTDCKAYSIMGRGEGVDSRAVVILQTVTYVCPIS